MKSINDLLSENENSELTHGKTTVKSSTYTAKSIIDRNRNRNYLKNKGITAEASIVLKDLFQTSVRDDHRLMPNDFARSSLFLATDKRKARVFFTRKKLFHIHSKVTIYYTGSELRSGDDELLWMQIIHYSIAENLGSKVSIPMSEILKDLNLARTKKNYERISDCLSRLKATEIFIENQATFGQSGGLSLIDNYFLDNTEHSNILHVSVPKELIILFAGNTFTNLPWEAYKQLKPVTKRLLDYCYSHKEPNPLSVAVFSHLCTGSDVVDTKNALQNARRACLELVEKNLLASAFVESGTIFIKRLTKYK